MSWAIDAEVIFFAEKVVKARSSTAAAPAPTFASRTCLLVGIYSHDFLRGCTFSSKKLTTLLVAALKTQAETAKLTTPNISRPPKNVLTNLTCCSALAGGALTAWGVAQFALTTFPYKLRPRPIFLRPGGYTSTLWLGYACLLSAISASYD